MVSFVMERRCAFKETPWLWSMCPSSFCWRFWPECGPGRFRRGQVTFPWAIGSPLVSVGCSRSSWAARWSACYSTAVVVVTMTRRSRKGGQSNRRAGESRSDTTARLRNSHAGHVMTERTSEPPHQLFIWE